MLGHRLGFELIRGLYDLFFYNKYRNDVVYLPRGITGLLRIHEQQDLQQSVACLNSVINILNTSGSPLTTDDRFSVRH